jgi:hypothetical protein
MPTSLYESNLGVNAVLTNIAQRFVQPEFCMRLLYPLVEVDRYSGQIMSFDDSAYDDVWDDRGDGDDYREIEDTFSGQPFILTTKGLKYRLPDNKRNQLGAMGYNWGQHAATYLMEKAALKHELQAIAIATNTSNYASSNVTTLTTGGQFGDSGVDPDYYIRTAKQVIASQIGVEPNVMIIGRNVFTALAVKYAKNFTATAVFPGMKPQLTEDILASMYGFERVRVCGAIVKSGGARTMPFAKHVVIARTNPNALNSDRTPWKTSGDIVPQSYSLGYTYVYKGNPLLYEPGRNEEKGYTYYKLDFHRSVVNVGVNQGTSQVIAGYLIYNASA